MNCLTIEELLELLHKDDTDEAWRLRCALQDYLRRRMR